jgi:hypothetical protein
MLMTLSFPPLAMACFQEINTGAASGAPAVAGNSTVSTDASGSPPEDGGCNANGCGCNAAGTCTVNDCDAGTPACPGSAPCFLQYGAGGGSFCQPVNEMTPPIDLNSDLDDAANMVTDPCTPAERDSLAIRTTYCAPCHGGGGAHSGGFDFVLDDNKLVSAVTSAPTPDGGVWRFVVPGDCDDSYVYYRISKSQMPPPGNPAPTISDLSVLRTWINCLAGSPLGPNGGDDAGSASDGTSE